jgi:ribonuclease Z
VHCAQAYALVIVAEGEDAEEVGGDPGWKLAYSGDTRPCPALTAASADATVLIHEATFEDGMDEDAARKRHSMTSEAIRTGRDARAYRTVLTHFSQRYPKVPAPFAGFERGGPGANSAAGCEETEARSREERRAFGVAFDLMRVDFRRDLPRLPALLPAIRALFPDREGDDE